MSSGNAPKSAGVDCAGKDGKACAENKKRAPDPWTSMLYVAKPMQIPAGHPHQQPPCSFLSKEVVEPQPALDTGEESDIDVSQRRQRPQRSYARMLRVGDLSSQRKLEQTVFRHIHILFELRLMHICVLFGKRTHPGNRTHVVKRRDDGTHMPSKKWGKFEQRKIGHVCSSL